jgi:predicted nucleotidyltransferase
MVEIGKIRDFRDQIVKQFKPIKIILFGSYAYGSPSSDSDVDILVILPFEGNSAYKSAEILDRIDPRFPVDLLARTPDQVNERLSKDDFFMKEIITKGKVLYEATDTRVD